MKSGVLKKLNIEEILGVTEYEFLTETITGTYSALHSLLFWSNVLGIFFCVDWKLVIFISS